MERRRKIQLIYNEEHGITPRSISRRMDELLESVREHDYVDLAGGVAEEEALYGDMSEDEIVDLEALRAQMREAAQKLEFESAAGLRDRIRAIERRQLGLTTGEAVK